MRKLYLSQGMAQGPVNGQRKDFLTPGQHERVNL